MIIGTGSKDKFSTDFPVNDKQFANFVLNPLLAQLFASLGIPVPPPPRNDLLLLVQYEPPICPGCGPNDAGPVADLLRLNTGIPPTAIGSQKRLGFLVGDAGWDFRMAADRSTTSSTSPLVPWAAFWSTPRNTARASAMACNSTTWAMAQRSRG